MTMKKTMMGICTKRNFPHPNKKPSVIMTPAIARLFTVCDQIIPFQLLKRTSGRRVVNQKIVDRANKESYDGHTVNPVFQFAEGGECLVFFRGQHFDVTNVTGFQLATMAMMEIVHPCPILERDGAEKTTDVAHDVVQLLILEERTVTTIMLDDKNTDEKKGVDDRQARA